MEFPIFTYHPDPIATGAVIKSDATCESCGKATGFVCTSTIYAVKKVDFICPWCIADGTAAKKFNGSFTDDYPLIEAGIDNKIIFEIAERTPGYISWQQEEWQSHCDDACEFHGDADINELKEMQGEQLSSFLEQQMLDVTLWKQLLTTYKKGGDPAIYKFKCRHCHKIIFTMDFS